MSGRTNRKLLVVQCAALAEAVEVEGLAFRPLASVFPAVTCTAQASFRTAGPPREHGVVGNGWMFRALSRVMFWEQSAGLVAGRRIWEGFRARGGTVGMLFWQQSLGEDVDVLLSPAPIHKHHGGMIQDCYGKPDGLYARLRGELDRPFRLRHYWGPLASVESGDWIAAATAAVIADPQVAPDLCLTYLPTLDYDLQRFGPDHPRSRQARAAMGEQLSALRATAAEQGYEMLVFGDYAIAPVSRAAFPNRALLKAGLMKVRDVRGMSYADLHSSRAFAVVDHEIAHVYVRDAADIPAARDALAGTGDVLGRDEQAALGVDHPNAGELVLLARQGEWLAYPWWDRKSEAPEFASHVDIHAKPGYDPCELFFGWPPPSVSRDAGRIRGSHGRAGPGREAVWADTCALGGEPDNLIDLAAAVRVWLEEA